MGADYQQREYKGTKKVVEDLWKQSVQEAIDDNGGRGYTGSLAEKAGEILEFRNTIFDTILDAEDWLQDNTPKWGSPIVVQAYESIIKPGRDEKFVGRIKVERDKVIAIEQKHLDKIKAGKSPNVSCKICGSKINRTYMTSPNCLVCDSTMLTKAEQTRIESIETRIEKLQDERRICQKGEKIWIVGTWCSS